MKTDMSYSEQQEQLEALEKRAAELTLELANVNAAILSLKNRQTVGMAPPPPLPSAWPTATPAPDMPAIPSLSIPPLPVAFAEEEAPAPPLPAAFTEEAPPASPLPAAFAEEEPSAPPLPDAVTEEEPPALPISAPNESVHETYVRLYGLLQNKEPWETRLPISLLARQGGVILGRDPETADIVVADGNISRAHARLELADNTVLVTDLGSTNGTFINGRALPPHTAQLPLWAGMPLTVGETTLYAEFV